MNSNFVNCPTCNTPLIKHYEAFEKMGIINRGNTENDLAEPVIYSSTDLSDKSSPIIKSIEKTRKYIKDNDLDICCVMRILGATNIDTVLSRIIVFGENKKNK